MTGPGNFPNEMNEKHSCGFIEIMIGKILPAVRQILIHLRSRAQCNDCNVLYIACTERTVYATRVIQVLSRIPYSFSFVLNYNSTKCRFLTLLIVYS